MVFATGGTPDLNRAIYVNEGGVVSDTDLIQRLRKASMAVYLATDEAVADDLSDMLKAAASRIEAAIE